MGAKVLAIWIDSADRQLVEDMTSAGELPVLASLRERGAWGNLLNVDHSGAETVHSQVLTGQRPGRGGGWTVGRFDPNTYSIVAGSRNDQGGLPVFYGLGNRHRVAAVDLPKQPLRGNVHGLQFLHWGTHSPSRAAVSDPPHLLPEILDRHGPHPTGDGRDHANPHDPASMRDLLDRSLEGVRLRERVLLDLLGRDDWDLFFAGINEPHSVGHSLWPHPDLHSEFARMGDPHPARTIHRAVDRMLGRLIDAVVPRCRVVVFSAEGMDDNRADLPSLVFLPELMHRFSFGGRIALDLKDAIHRPTPEKDAGIRNWVMELWHSRRPPSWWSRFIGPPALEHPADCPFWGWQPTAWYRSCRRFMKAFALPSNSDGFVRLNVRGREKHGLVAPGEFGRVCAAIAKELRSLRCGNTTRPAVERVIPIRSTPDVEPGSHDADLVVVWSRDVRNVVVSPRYGRLGPVPYHRTGGHTPHGFLCAAGPGIAAGSTFACGSPMDVGPTVLSLMGIERTRSLPGRRLLDRATIHAA